MINPESFWQEVSNVLHWWEYSLEKRTKFRSEFLRPTLPHEPPGLPHDVCASGTLYEQPVLNVRRRRARALADFGLALATYSPEQCRQQSRLLVYQPGYSINDGLSESESEGFFDWHDCPPWDLWLFAERSDSKYSAVRSDLYLFTVVPRSIESRVARGIESNCVACIGWATSDLYDGIPLFRSMHDAGLLF